MGLVRRSVANPVAANMVMLLLLAGGVLAALVIPRELFPEFEIDTIVVTVPFPGATPSEIEEGICLKIEDSLTGLEGVKESSAESREGVGTVLLELYSRADASKVLDDVKSAVDKIEFPKEAEDHTVYEATIRTHVINVAVAGDIKERPLTRLAEQIRDEINDLPAVTQVSVSGVRDYEISVEVSEESMRQYKLTLAQISHAIRTSSFDLPAGSVKTRSGDMAIRVVGQLYTAEEFKSVPVLSRPDGTVVRLGEIAQVLESFEDIDIGGQFNGQPAALVSVFKTPDEDSIKIAEAVKEYVRRKKREFPEGIVLETWSDRAKLVSDRLSMLVSNGMWGLGLVFLTLWLFLGWRLSFWVAMGIPVSILGALLVLHLGGTTLNMMSMFALIMTLGLIVDDAIVVGENIYTNAQAGKLPDEAAVTGTSQVLLPVIAAVTTTLLAFSPLLMVPGIMGRFIAVLPITVILALSFSLLECIGILPPHLAHSLKRRRAAAAAGGWLTRRMAETRRRIDAGIHDLIHRRFARLYDLAARYRYATVAAALGIVVIMGGAIAGGWIKVTGFMKVDSDTLQAKLTMPTGTSFEKTGDIARDISEAAIKLNEQFKQSNGAPVVERAYSLLGAQTPPGAERGSHIADILVELQPSEERRVTSEEIIAQWRENAGMPTGALSLTFSARRGGPGGKALEIRLLGRTTEQCKQAAGRLKEKLGTYPGVTDIEDDALPGKTEMKIRLKRGARALGINLDSLASQMRGAFHGEESMKIQRGRDEVKVMVRYPEHYRRSLGDVEAMRVRTPNGAEVPFYEVADVTMGRGYTTLRRVGRNSAVTVSADVEEAVANAEQILGDLKGGGFFEELESSFPGLKLDLRGQREQIFESLGALMVWFPLALVGIYTLLAGLFRSYLQPIIIMMAIPFGLIGAVVGHWIFGFNLTLLSMFGMVALAGIVVNDSLVLIDLVNRKVRGGNTPHEAARAGSLGRFRPIVLTTITTVCGIAPILFERSFQAQFLKPMAVSIAFGLLFSTAMTLLVVPSLYLIGQDILAWWRRASETQEPAAVEPVA